MAWGMNSLSKVGLVALTLTSWNRVLLWLQNMDLLRRTGGFELLNLGQKQRRQQIAPGATAITPASDSPCD
jgi:hypothetical protein